MSGQPASVHVELTTDQLLFLSDAVAFMHRMDMVEPEQMRTSQVLRARMMSGYAMLLEHERVA